MCAPEAFAGALLVTVVAGVAADPVLVELAELLELPAGGRGPATNPAGSCDVTARGRKRSGSSSRSVGRRTGT